MYPSVLLIQYPSLLKANSKIGGVSISQHVLGGNDLTSPRGGTDHHFSFAIPASFVGCLVFLLVLLLIQRFLFLFRVWISESYLC